MSGDVEHKDKQDIEEKMPKKKSLWGKVLKIILRIALIFIASLFIVSTGFIVLSQTSGFRQWLSVYLYNIINNELEGKLTFSEVKLNPLKGSLEINDVCLVAAGDTLVNCKLVDVNFDLKPLLIEKAKVRSIILDSPNIKIFRSRKDSSWNLEHIAKPSANKTKSKSNWIIEISKFEIKNGKVSLYDSTSIHPITKNIDYGNLNLKQFNLELSALLKLKEPSFVVNIKSLNFIEINSNQHLNNLSLAAKIDNVNMEVSSLTINTPETKIDVQARLSNINVFGDSTRIDFGNAPLNLSLKTKPISTDEFLRFVPLPFILKGPVGIDLIASGCLNNLDVNKLNLKFAKSEIKLSGNLKNIIKPEKFSYDVNINDTRVDISDVFNLLPWLNREAIPDFGVLNMNNTKVVGSVDSLSLKTNASSSLGKISGTTGLGFKNILTYSGVLNTENFNLSNILHNNSFSSSINSVVDFKGSGTDLKNLILNLGIKSTNSRFTNYNYNNLDLAVNVDGKGTIFIDTLKFLLNNKQSFDSTVEIGEEPARINISGILNLTNISKPVYDVKIKLNSLNIASLTGNQFAPQYFEGDISVKGEGFEPDSISGTLKAKVSECVFADRALTPFQLDADFIRESESRTLKINSDFLNVSLTGDYSYSNLENMLGIQGDIISVFVQSNFDKFNIKNNPVRQNQVEIKTSGFKPMNLCFHSDIKDLSLLAVFLKKTKLHSISTIDIKWDVINNESKIRLDSFIVHDFELDAPNLQISSRPVTISGNIGMKISDSVPVLNQAKIDLIASSDIVINSLNLKDPYAKINLSNGKADFELSSTVNDLISFYDKGNINFKDSIIEATIINSKIMYHDSVLWTASKPIIVNLSNRGIEIQSLTLQRKNAESISLAGIYNENDNNLFLNVNNFNFRDLGLFIPPENKKMFDTLRGTLDSVELHIKGKLDNPELGLNLFANDISYNGTYIGNISGNLNHKDSLVSANLEITNPKRENNKKTLSVDIRSLPLNLAFTPVQNRIHKTSAFDVQIKAEDLPLELAAPFIPALEKLKGDADAAIQVTGYAPDKIDITGNLQFDNTSFIIAANNISYKAYGKIELKHDKIVLSGIEIFNMPDDYKPGKALIKGEIGFENFQLGDFDIDITSPSLKVLSQTSIKAMPTLYGDLIISTGLEPLRFFGTPEEPYLEGDVNIDRANLLLPSTNITQVKKSAFRYEEINHYLRIIAIKDSTAASDSAKTVAVTKPLNNERKKDIGELIDYDLNIRLEGNFFVNMEMGYQQTLFAELGVKDPTQPLRFVMKHGNSEPKLFGDIVVKEGSTLKFYKQFTTSGSISFPTGNVTNPGLDLVAEYSGMSTISNEPRNYKVILFVTGTKEKPIIKFSYTINDNDAVGDSSKIREDAILLLIFGKTKEELVGGSNKGKINLSDIADIGSTASAAASSFLTDALQGTGIIQSADIDFGKGSWEEATLKISGQIYGTKWKVGGNVADFSNNSEFSIEYPLPWALSPVIQITRSINTSNPTTKNQKEFEFKIKIGNSW